MDTRISLLNIALTLEIRMQCTFLIHYKWDVMILAGRERYSGSAKQSGTFSSYMSHLRICSLSVIGDAFSFLSYCLTFNFQEVFEDPNRDERFSIELFELKEHVTNAGSARWFLQDLAAKQATENSLVCHII